MLVLPVTNVLRGHMTRASVRHYFCIYLYQLRTPHHSSETSRRNTGKIVSPMRFIIDSLCICVWHVASVHTDHGQTMQTTYRSQSQPQGNNAFVRFRIREKASQNVNISQLLSYGIICTQYYVSNTLEGHSSHFINGATIKPRFALRFRQGHQRFP